MTDSGEKRSPLSKLREIYTTANNEHEDATLGQKAILASTLGGLAFEWSTGNESMLGFVSGKTYELTGNPAITSLAAGTASFAEQGVIGALMATTIHNYPEVTAKVREMVGHDDTQGSFLNRYASAMILGTGVELAKENAVRPHDRAENLRRATGNAAMIAASNTVLIAGMSGLIKLGEKHGFESASETVVDVASNPLTYVGIIGGVLGYSQLKKAIARRRSRKNSSSEHTQQNSSDRLAKSRFKGDIQEVIRTPDDLTISVTDYIPEEEHELLWGMVHSGFQDLNRKSYEKQDMTRDELIEDLHSENVLKYIARDKEANLVGLLTVHVGLDDISWTDTDKLIQRQNESDKDATPYYVGTIVVPVNERGTSTAENLIHGALVHFQETNTERDEDSIVFFDCAQANYPWLPEFIQSMGQPTDQSPDLVTDVIELYQDAWVNEDGVIHKIHAYDANDEADVFIDAQHYHAIAIQRK